MMEVEPFCEFTVPGDIVPWARARLGLRGVPFTPPKVRSYQTVLRDKAKEAMAGANPHDGACRLLIVAYFAWPSSWSTRHREKEGPYKRSRPDGSNIQKSVEDAMNGIVFTDDARAADVRVMKLYAEASSVVVKTWKLDGGHRGGLLERKPETTPRVEQGALELMEGGR